MLNAVFAASITTAEKCLGLEKEVTIPKLELSSNFKLPMEYLPSNQVHEIPRVVSTDLELLHTTCSDATDVSGSMYSILLQPTHEFAKKTMRKWNKQFSSNVDFLEDTQTCILNMENMNYARHSEKNDSIWNCDEIIAIWKELKENDMFLEKYGYMEWTSLKFLNENSVFLQCLSILQLISPLMSLMIPIILLIIPFLILKMQRINITLDTYIQHLKLIARSHIIGKAIQSFESFSPSSFVYFVVTLIFYMLQIYQNISGFIRFNENIQRVNRDIIKLKAFIQYSIYNMNSFVETNGGLDTYDRFIVDIKKHRDVLLQILGEIDCVGPFCKSLQKFTSLGYLLKCYYSLHSNVEYEKSLLYAFGFEGYMDNLKGLYNNVACGNVNIASFCHEKIEEEVKENAEENENTEGAEGADNESEYDKPTSVYFKGQYYPPHGIGAVKNNVSLKKNMIITGVNASGKTTTLKTVAINTIFTQQFGVGFYGSCNMIPFHHIHSYLNIPDTSERDSLFQAESRRCKEIIDMIKENSTKRHLCILDELYSGTNPVEATKSAFAFLKYVSKFENVRFILTTHYTSICNKIEANGNIANYYMKVENEDSDIVYTYELLPGICEMEGAINILKNMDYPKEIIDNIICYV